MNERSLPSAIDAQTVRLREGSVREGTVPDRVAVEAPLEIRVRGAPLTVIMRTPGHDEELVRGFLHTEGVLGAFDEIVAIRRPEGLPDGERGNVVEVELGKAASIAPAQRHFYGSASCGVCGKTSIASLAIHARPNDSRLQVTRRILGSLPERMRGAQAAYLLTGGVHASGLFAADGTLLAVREDVGRHNATDKLVGFALGERMLPLRDRVLVVSGRIGFEIVQKAIAAGIPILAAVGAPSSLALDLGDRYGVTLAGFVRPDSMNIYTHPRRILDD